MAKSSNRETEINIALTKEAREIYDNLPEKYKPKNKFVSKAIINEWNREQGISLEQEIAELKHRVNELERLVGKCP